MLQQVILDELLEPLLLLIVIDQIIFYYFIGHSKYLFKVEHLILQILYFICYFTGVSQFPIHQIIKCKIIKDVNLAPL